jgi:ATP-dependent exoDNAse (exonuclease V) alpha subunit
MYAANGDIAQVVEIEAKHLLATLVVGNETIMIPKGRVFQQDVDADGDPDPNEKEQPNTGCSWDLAYALSVHKSQGSEFPVCIVMLDTYPGAMRISSREWLYTATSRGKKLQIEIGLGDTTDRMVRRVALGKRKTLLAEQINHIQCERLVGEL